MKYLIGLILFLSVVTSQVTDKNFKEKIGHEDAVIVEAKDSDTKKICKKLRIRNFPSIALFFDGSKKEVWKADMDGEVDVSPSDIKSAIDDVLAEDVF